MVFLRVILIIALVIAFILSLRPTVRIIYSGSVTLRAGVFVPFLTVLPKKKKKIRLSSFTYEKHKKRLEKEKRKKGKKAVKEAEKNAKNELRDKVGEVSDSEGKSAEEKVREIISLLRLVCDEFPRLASRLRIKIRSLHITVAGEDAAETAVKYGGIQAAVSLLAELLESKTRLSPIKTGDAEVRADFTSQKTTAELDISLSISLFAILKTALSALVFLVRAKIKKDNPAKA